ncbi:MAG: GNAT family N-acetyltransferase [Candidatus Poribacteria bacterium]|nr:GNAT family N-acetyltransferase [Candidatus Poribacteria bacterium]
MKVAEESYPYSTLTFTTEFVLPRIRVRVRAATEADLDAMEWAGGYESRATHEDRLDDQETGSALYLVACVNDHPVGYAMLRWAGRPTAPDYPDIEDMGVFPALRGYGIGTALIEACERVARERGHSRIGLAVNPTRNSSARALYERIGFRFSGTSPYHDTTRRIADPNGDHLVMEMVKEFAPSGG